MDGRQTCAPLGLHGAGMELQPVAPVRATRTHRRRYWASVPRQGPDMLRNSWPGQETGCMRAMASRAHEHLNASAKATPVTVVSGLQGTAAAPDWNSDAQQLQPPDHDGLDGAQQGTHQLHHASAQPPQHTFHTRQYSHSHSQYDTVAQRSPQYQGHLAVEPRPTHSSRPARTGAWLMGVIKQRTTPHELLAALQQNIDQLNMLHASAALTHAMQMQQQQLQQHGGAWGQAGTTAAPLPSALTVLLLQLQLEHLPSFRGRQVANSLWALSKLQQGLPAPGQQPGQPASPQQLLVERLQLQVLTGLVARLSAVIPEMKPQELASTWYALGCMRVPGAATLLPQVLQAASRFWHEFKPQELANMLWATAHMPDLVHGPVWISWVRGLMQAQACVVDSSSPYELSYSLWAGAQLRSSAERHRLRGAGSGNNHAERQAQEPSLHAGPPGSSTGQQHQQQGEPQIWQRPNDNHGQEWQDGGAGAGATKDHFEQQQQQQQEEVPAEAWLAWSLAVSVGLQHNTSQLAGPQLVQALSALPLLPPSQMHRQLALDLLRHASMLVTGHQLTARCSASILLAAANLGLRPSRATRTWAHTMLHALLEVPSPVASSSPSSAPLSVSPADTAMSLYALAQLRCQPSPAAAQLLLEQARLQLGSGNCKPGEVALMLWACASLHLQPPAGFLLAFQRASFTVREQLAAREMAAMFWALGQLQLRPGPRWLQYVLDAAWRRHEEYTDGELLHMLSGLGRMRHNAAGDAYDRLVAELQRRCSGCVPHTQLLAALRAVARAQPATCSAVRWAHDELLPILLARHLPALNPAQLTILLWSAGRLARLPPLSTTPAAPPDAPPLLSPWGWQESLPTDPLLMPDGAHEDEAGMDVELRRLPWQAGSGREEVAAAVAAVRLRSVEALEEPPVAHDAQDVLHALAAGLPAQQLLQGSAEGAGALLLQWQRLRQRPGRLVLPDRHVCAVLRACMDARGRLTPQQLAVVLFALPQLNVQPSRTWTQRMLFGRPHLLSSFTHHELALVLFALGCMRMRLPPEWMHSCLQQVQDRAPYMNGNMVSGVLRGLSMLGLSPGSVWMSQFVVCTVPVLRRMRPRQLSAVYAAVVDLEVGLAEDWGNNFGLLLQPANDVSPMCEVEVRRDGSATDASESG